MEIIRQNNSEGVSVLYIGPGKKWNNIFENNQVLWDAHKAALAIAETPRLEVDGKPVIAVDCNREFLGFYTIDSKTDSHVVLLPMAVPRFRGHLPPGPRRPTGPVHGHHMTKEALNKYIFSLKTFIG